MSVTKPARHRKDGSLGGLYRAQMTERTSNAWDRNALVSRAGHERDEANDEKHAERPERAWAGDGRGDESAGLRDQAVGIAVVRDDINRANMVHFMKKTALRRN